VKQNVTGGTRHQGDATQLRTEREAFGDETIPQTSRCELPVSMSRLESLVVYVGGLTTLKLVFRRWLQKFQHHKPTYVAKDR
jgi:hypothetical protein